MTIEELDIHPLAQAVLRYFMVPRAAQTSQLAPEEVLEHLLAALQRLTPVGLQQAGADLVDVARFMRVNGLYRFAEQVANTVARAANAKLVEHGAAAVVALDYRMANRQLPALPATPPASKQPGLVESKWASFDESRRERLGELADQFIRRPE